MSLPELNRENATAVSEFLHAVMANLDDGGWPEADPTIVNAAVVCLLGALLTILDDDLGQLNYIIDAIGGVSRQ